MQEKTKAEEFWLFLSVLQKVTFAFCLAQTLVMLMAIQKDSSDSGGITWVLKGPINEIWEQVSPSAR